MRIEGGFYAEFIRKTYKLPKGWAHIEMECKYKERGPSYKLDLPKVMQEHQGHKVSRFEDCDVYVYSNVKIDEASFINVVGFIYGTGAHYESYPADVLMNYRCNPLHALSDYITDSGRRAGKNYGKWMEEHDDELRWCFEMTATGQEPEPFK
jgi:hypothetical protein